MTEGEFDQSLPIFCIETGKTYPAPEKFDNKSPLRYKRENLKLWGRPHGWTETRLTSIGSWSGTSITMMCCPGYPD